MPSGRLDKSGFGESGIINRLKVDDFEDANAAICLAVRDEDFFVGGYVTAGADAFLNPGTKKGIVFAFGRDGKPLQNWGAGGHVKLPFIPEQIEVLKNGHCVATATDSNYNELDTLHVAVIDRSGNIVQKISYEDTLISKLTRTGLYRGVQEGRHIRVYSVLSKKTEFLSKAMLSNPVALDIVADVGCVLVYSHEGKLIRREMQPVVDR